MVGRSGLGSLANSRCIHSDDGSLRDAVLGQDQLPTRRRQWFEEESCPTPHPLPQFFTPDQVATLVRMLRVAYPHDRFPECAVRAHRQAIEGADTDGPLRDGIAALDQAADGDFGSLSAAEATAVLERVSQSPFFRFVHATTVVTLYDDHEVWDLLGYEGESFSKGGYLRRGFDDLDRCPCRGSRSMTGCHARRSWHPGRPDLRPARHDRLATDRRTTGRADGRTDRRTDFGRIAGTVWLDCSAPGFHPIDHTEEVVPIIGLGRWWRTRRLPD